MDESAVVRGAWRLAACVVMLLSVSCGGVSSDDDPVAALLERIDAGASRKFIIERIEGDPCAGRFELSDRDGRIVVRGTDIPAITAGIHWYLKYHAGIHLSWDCMTARLPDTLPAVGGTETRRSSVALRYAFNYCTFSYSMAFWDWPRWEREIDWMALHGINMPLMAVGMEKVWLNVLLRLGYDASSAAEFIAGPAFQAWWLMDNLEGWGGPSPEGWYDDRAELARKIVGRMRQLGMEPVLPGYSGRMPSDAGRRLGIDAVPTGTWCGYSRPSFLRPDSERFAGIADIYYEELERLYGPARYYSCDPFHEGGLTAGVDLAASGRAILDAMKRRSADAVWVVQAWQDNPRRAMIDSLPADDVVVLDLFSESRPQWGEPSSEWYRPDGFGSHPWVYCMLLNFGGNVGLYGKLQYVADGFFDAAAHPHAGQTLAGVGMTPEGIENNPVMFELLTELPWLGRRPDTGEWLRRYAAARYGFADAEVDEAWALLARSVYGCPKESTQEGTCESVFCARPVLDYVQTSEFAGTDEYYDPRDVARAARLMLGAAGRHSGNPHFEYDLIDIVRQCVADAGRIRQRRMARAFRSGDADAFARESRRFLELILIQDRLLSSHAAFMLGPRLAAARALGRDDDARALLEWNARVQITTWGNRDVAERGRLHDYAHKEWSGLLSGLYYDRWACWAEAMEQNLRGADALEPLYYDMESAWASGREEYPVQPSGDCTAAAREAFEAVAGEFGL